MGIPITNLVNSAFGWFIVLLAIAGYFLTLKRMGEKWMFWVVLAGGWGFFALANTLLVAGVPAGEPYLVAIWLSSYILVTVSLVLFFVKVMRVKQPQ
jgi:hypothetical protein